MLTVVSALAGLVLLAMATSVLRNGNLIPSPMAHRTPPQQRLPWLRRIGYAILYGLSGLALLALMSAATIHRDITVTHAMEFAVNHVHLLAVTFVCASVGIFLSCWPDTELRLLERSYPDLSGDPEILPAILATIQLIGIGFMLIATVIMVNLRE